jgi:hypothetical protein
LPINIIFGLYIANSFIGYLPNNDRNISTTLVKSINITNIGQHTLNISLNTSITTSSINSFIGKPIVIKIYQNTPTITNSSKMNSPFIITNIQLLEEQIENTKINNGPIPLNLLQTNTKLFEKFVNINYLNKNDTTLDDVSTVIDHSYAGYKHSEEEIKIKNNKLFNVLDYGADNSSVSNYEADNSSTKKYAIDAIQAAIDDAIKNGGGIVFLPRGTYMIGDNDDGSHIISSSGNNNIVIQGEDWEQTIIYIDKPSSIKMFHQINIKSYNADDVFPRKIIKDSPRGSNTIYVESTRGFQVGDTIKIMSIRNQEFIDKYKPLYYGDLPFHHSWTGAIDGSILGISLFYEIEKIDKINKIITIKGALHTIILANLCLALKQINYIEYCGIENITFKGSGRYIDKYGRILGGFIHHYGDQSDVINEVGKERAIQLNIIHDAGWNPFIMNGTVNCWIKNIINDSTSGIGGFDHTSRNCTIDNIIFKGKRGHCTVEANGTNHLIKNIFIHTNYKHGPNLNRSSNGCVIKNVQLLSNQTIDFHSRDPSSNLIDNIRGGVLKGFGGGQQSKPGHGRWLTVWNFSNQNDQIYDYDFWYYRTNDLYAGSDCIVLPIITGFGNTIRTVKNVEFAEKINEVGFIYPVSLFDAQLKLRLFKNNIKNPHTDMLTETYGPNMPQPTINIIPTIIVRKLNTSLYTTKPLITLSSSAKITNPNSSTTKVVNPTNITFQTATKITTTNAPTK